MKYPYERAFLHECKAQSWKGFPFTQGGLQGGSTGRDPAWASDESDLKLKSDDAQLQVSLLKKIQDFLQSTMGSKGKIAAETKP